MGIVDVLNNSVFRVGNFEYTAEVVDKDHILTVNGVECAACVDMLNHSIQIKNIGDSQNILKLFIHECIHAMVEDRGISFKDNSDIEEAVVENLDKIFTSFIADNVQLLHTLVGEAYQNKFSVTQSENLLSRLEEGTDSGEGKKVSSDTCLQSIVIQGTSKLLNVGDEVKVHPDHCYDRYTTFVEKHKEYAIRWVYKESPKEDGRYTILGIYNHVESNKYDSNGYVVVVQNLGTNQIYLMGESGVIKC